MKIAITATGSSLDDAVDPRFGRASGFLIVDVDTMETTHLPNDALKASQGAGISAAEAIARAEACALLTGAVGPKAFQALSVAGVKVYHDLDGGTVREAVERYRRGELEAASAPAHGGHPG